MTAISVTASPSAATIVARATAPGRAGVAVIRVSGPQASAAAQAVFANTPPPRHATYGAFVDPSDGTRIDDGLGLWFPAPHSFTGEDVFEAHCHGGKAVVEALLDALCALPGLRPAEPGEFTRRAYENGKLDLTQAEGLADLIDAQTEAQRKQALGQMDGILSQQLDQWRRQVTTALAHLEAYLDFPYEPIPTTVVATVRADVKATAEAMGACLDDGQWGQRIRDGLSIVILGAPNAGKSSLINALARREVAIVSATVGTTRDVIEVPLDVGGYPVVIADTAGLREDVSDAIEAEGVRRAQRRAEAADLCIAVFDGAAWPSQDRQTQALVEDGALAVVSKTDLINAVTPFTVCDRKAYGVCATSGAGLAELIGALTARVDAALQGRPPPVLTRQRHRAALTESHSALERSLHGQSLELAAEDLRLALRALGRIAGRVDVEDLLDVVFSDFCIGK